MRNRDANNFVSLLTLRRREKRSSRSRRSPSWLEREHIDWEAFPPPKLFSLSQRLDRPLPPGSPVYSEIIRSYENRGYERSEETQAIGIPLFMYTSGYLSKSFYSCQHYAQLSKNYHKILCFLPRSQENLQRSSHTAYPTYPVNSQIYPALVFQRLQTEPNPTSSSPNPVYVQISTSPKNRTPRGPSVTHPQTSSRGMQLLFIFSSAALNVAKATVNNALLKNHMMDKYSQINNGKIYMVLVTRISTLIFLK